MNEKENDLGLSPETWAQAEEAARILAPHGVMFPAKRPSFAPPSGPTQAETLARRQIAASLAGGMIAATGRAHTAAEALAVFKDVFAAVEAV